MRSPAPCLHPTLKSMLGFFKHPSQSCREMPASHLWGAWPFPCRSLARHGTDQKPAPVWQMLCVLSVGSQWLVLASGRQADRPAILLDVVGTSLPSSLLQQPTPCLD